MACLRTVIDYSGTVDGQIKIVVFTALGGMAILGSALIIQKLLEGTESEWARRRAKPAPSARLAMARRHLSL